MNASHRRRKINELPRPGASARVTLSAEAAPATIDLPIITGSASVQLALSTVINAVAAGALDAARARVLLYGLQIAATNARHIAAAAKAEEPARAARETTPAAKEDPLAIIHRYINFGRTEPAETAGVKETTEADESQQTNETEATLSMEAGTGMQSDEAPSLPTPATASPAHATAPSACNHRTYQAVTRSRLLAIKRRRDELAGPALAPTPCPGTSHDNSPESSHATSGQFGDERSRQASPPDDIVRP